MSAHTGLPAARTVRRWLVLALFACAVLAALVMNIHTGSVSVSPVDILRILFGHGMEDGTEYGIIMSIRLPRLLAAAVLGGALSVSGFMLQAYFRNPIAGPFVLGISSGARMAVGFTLIVLMNRMTRVPTGMLIFASFIGSMLSMGFVLLCAKKVKSMAMLLVVGIMIGYICSAVTDFFITFAKEAQIVDLTSWSMGSFSGMKWGDLRIASIVVAVALACAFAISKPMGAYQLGEGYAQSLGVNVRFFRIALIVVSSLLSGVVTAFAGPISFVGIAVPHIARLALGTAKPAYVIPASFLCGAAFCMFCDLVARTAFAPVELAIGTVTAVFGAPTVIWLMVSRRKGARS